MRVVLRVWGVGHDGTRAVSDAEIADGPAGGYVAWRNVANDLHAVLGGGWVVDPDRTPAFVTLRRPRVVEARVRGRRVMRRARLRSALVRAWEAVSRVPGCFGGVARW